MKKRFFSGILALTLLFSMLPVFSPAVVTAEAASGNTDWNALSAAGKFDLNGTYYISNAEELALFRDIVNTPPYDSSLYSCTFYLTADIELNSPDQFLYSNKGHIRQIAPGAEVDNWDPIGNDYSLPFTGHFDGQGHTISGLYCHVWEGYAGLFGFIADSASVRNLHISNAYIYGRDGDAGGITASSGNADISGCSFDGFVYAGGTSGQVHRGGGIAGLLTGGRVNDCTADASVAAYYAGGICGGVKNYNSAVNNCYTTGEVTALNSSSAVAGGIAGEAGGLAVIRNCGSTMDIFSTFGGGICGQAKANGGDVTIENCWFAGAFTGGVVANPRLAGIAVIAEGYEEYVHISHCYTSYRSSSYLFRSEGALQKPDQGENGGGLFDDSLTVITTTSDGYSAYWEKDDEGYASEFLQVADTPYALSGRTHLTVALNAWAAEQGEGYRFWTVGSDQLPLFLQDSWGDAAGRRLDLNGEIISVHTATELAQLAATVNSGNSLEGKQVVLCNAIDLSGKRWTPIGTAEHPFAGSFDGQGYLISGLVVDSGADHAGLFGVASGTLSNIQLQDATVYGGSGSGGIVGAAEGEIDSCSFSGAVYASGSSGGIVGIAADTVTNCRNDGIVSGSTLTGAIAGSCDATVGNCFSSGAVYSGTALFNMRTTLFNGNIVGSGTVDNCYDASAVVGDGDELLTALSAAAAENPSYTNWTATPAANKGLPYYAAFSGGAGTEEDPLRITTLEQLSYLGTLVHSGADQSGIHYRLDSDLTLNDGYFDDNGNWYNSSGASQPSDRVPILWTPIGAEGNSFAGSFDGAGHTVSGLFCDTLGGLFGDLGGSVRNLLLANGYFAEGESAVAAANCGSIVNCGSSCAGSGSIPDGENCWDLTDIPSLKQLNNWVAAHGSDYHLWYAVPGSDALSFRPTQLPIIYTLGGGERNDDLTHYIYGEELPVPAAPSREGYLFAGWSVYVNATSNGAAPTFSFLMGGDTVDTSHAETLRLEAIWAETDKTLFDYCSLIDGVYVLNCDVTLAEPVVFLRDTVLDLNGHTLQGHGDTALLMAVGCSLRLCSSGSDGEIRSNAAAAGGIGGQLITPGAAPMDRVFFVSGDAQEYLLTAYTPVEDCGGMAYLASYNEFGQMLSVETVSDVPTKEISILLTAEELMSAARIRCFILPTCWFD